MWMKTNYFHWYILWIKKCLASVCISLVQNGKIYNITFKLCPDISVVMVKLEGDLIQLEGYCAARCSTAQPNRRIHLLWSESRCFFFPPLKFMFECESVILLAVSLCICYGNFQCHALYDLYPQIVSNKSCLLFSGGVPSEWILVGFAMCTYSFTSSIINLSI